MIKVVLIDIDNTLLDFDLCSRYAIIEACKELGVEFSETLFSTFTEMNNNFWHQVEDGTLTKDRLHEIRWNSIFARLNIVADGAMFEKAFRVYLDRSAEVVEGANEIVEYLSKKYVLAVASNSFLEQQKTRLKKAGMAKHIKHYFVSEDVGFNKPSIDFFCHCLNALGGVDKNSVIMIGDSISADVKGGIRAGIKTCWFNKYKLELPSGVKPDYIVTDLKEIKKFL